MRNSVLVGKFKGHGTGAALAVYKPVCFLLAEICHSVKSKGYGVRKGGFAGAVMPCDTGYVTEGKDGRLFSAAKAG